MLHRPAFVAFAMVIAAIALAVFASAGNVTPVARVWQFGARHWLVPHFFDGRMRVFWIATTDETLDVSLRTQPAQIRVHPMVLARPPEGLTLPGPGQYALPRDIRIGIGVRRSVPLFAMQFGQWSALPWALGKSLRISFVRMPDWLLPAVLLLYPLYAVFRGPMLQRKRKKKQLCENCGYDLTGATGTRCSECGAEAGRAAVPATRGAS